MFYNLQPLCRTAIHDRSDECAEEQRSMASMIVERTYIRTASANHLILMPIDNNIDITSTWYAVGALPCLEAGKTRSRRPSLSIVAPFTDGTT